MMSIALVLVLLFPVVPSSKVSLLDMASFHAGTKTSHVDEKDAAVSAEEIWEYEKAMKLLGLEDHDSNSDNEKIETTVVPSLLSALYDKMTSPSNVLPERCRIPGMKGNVVRYFRNKGRLLYQDPRRTVLELKFATRNAFHIYEDISEARLKVEATFFARRFVERLFVPQIASPALPKSSHELWNSVIHQGFASLPRFKYEIFLADEKLILAVKQSTLSLHGHGELEFHSPPLVTEYYTAPFKNENQVLVTSLIRAWRKISLSKTAKYFSRAILLITVESGNLDSTQCKPLFTPQKLITTSYDRRQCPFPVSSSGTDNIMERNRVKRDTVPEEIKEKMIYRFNNSEWISGSLGSNERSPNRSEKGHKKRSSGHIRSEICKRHSMYVPFDDVGWGHWIIAPKGLDAYRCAGDCPFPLAAQLGGNNHALLMTMMRSVDPDPENAPSPKCVPATYSSTPILYFDTTGAVVLRQYENMIVETCGCR